MSDVSRETSQALIRFEALVRAWSPKINLVAKSTLPEIASRHIADSAQVAEMCPDADTWCDLGSGGGFPGIVVAILLPETRVTLIESDARKAVFLRHAARELGLTADVLNTRIEAAIPAGAEVVSARALAPLDRLLPLAQRHGRKGTRYLFPKGARYRDEIAAARETWSFDIDVRPSKTDNEAVILCLENLSRV